MIPNSFKFWSTTNRDETLPVYDTSASKSRKGARVSPYPTRPVPSDGYPLMPLRTKVSISDQLVQCQTYNLKVPKPVFRSEALGPLIASPGPSENKKPDSALVAPEHYHGASPAPHNLIPAPDNPVQCQTNNLKVPKPVFETTTDVLGPLIAIPGPSENQKPDSALVASKHYHGASPAPDNPIPAPESLVQDTEALVQDTESLVDSPISQVNFNSVVQHTSSQSPLRLNLQKKLKPKRRHSGETGEKTRLVPQDVLQTRIANQEKDRMIEKLKDQVSD